MKRMITKCPGCQGTLHIAKLQCPDCGMELKNDFSLSRFDRLDDAQYEFLLAFLKSRWSLKEVQAELQLSYPAAKRKLEELLTALDLSETTEKKGEVDMSNLKVEQGSTKASEIIKGKIKENGGHVTVYTARGLPCEITAEPDGKTFSSNKLPVSDRYDYKVFDVIVDLLLEQGGRARKGNGRNYKLGEKGCETDTVVGAIAVYRGYELGASVYDPVFVMAAVLEWAGIAKNGRGELILTNEYKSML